MPNLFIAKCCAIPAGCFNPWIKGVSCDGYDCNPPKSDRVTLSIGTDFGLTTYASFTDGFSTNPCQYDGIGPWDRDFADTNPTEVPYSTGCNDFPSAINYCCCATGSNCTPSQGGTQCGWFANDNKYPGSWFTDFNLLCLKTGVDITSQTVEEDNYIACCGSVFMGEPNCGEVACGCDQLYGDTLCNRSRIAYTFGDPCTSGGPCPPYVGYQYFTDEPVLTTYYGFAAAVAAGVIGALDPVGVYQTALTFNSLTGDQFTARVVLNDHIVDPINDIIDYPGILQPYFGTAPDLDTAFPIGVYSPMGIVPGGNPPWVTITLNMTTGPYSGNTYTYNFYGTAAQFAAWALLYWDPVKTGRISIVGSPDYWMGLRVPPDALNTLTGQYIPVHEYRRIMTRTVTLGYMPDNSDDFELFSTTSTNVVWKARLRQFYTWKVFTTMQDIRVHGMQLDLLVSNGGCCNFEHCTRTRTWYGVTGADPAVAPCTVNNPLIDISGTCNGVGVPLNTHTDNCKPSNCAAAQQEISYEGYCRGYTLSTCFPSQYNVDMSYGYTQDPDDFECSNSACIDLPP